MSNTITVTKRDHTGQIKLTYTGEIIQHGRTWVCLRALFTFDHVDMGFVVFERDDVFTEWYYANRWYNIFQVNGRDDGQLKGWYCNITRPAIITADTVASDDLALDVYVMPDGEVRLLDEDEFEALDLPANERQAALNAVESIRRSAENGLPPFHLIELD